MGFCYNKTFLFLMGSSTMKSTTLTCVSACVLLILAPTGPVQGKSLLAIMSKQAETLQHGLDLASKVGDIGKLSTFTCSLHKLNDFLNIQIFFFKSQLRKLLKVHAQNKICGLHLCFKQTFSFHEF